MAKAQHRGTGPSSAKNQPRKITIGDGSIRDLVYFLMGGDVTTKKGRKKVASSDVRNEVQSLVRAQMQENSPFTPDYAAREREFNRVVQRNRTPSPPPQEPQEVFNQKGLRGYSNPNIPIQKKAERPAIPLSVINEMNRSENVMDKRYTNNPAILREGEYGDVDAYAGDPEFDIMMTPPGGGMAYGGPVRKRRKKRKYGGKMKKYAKGGGIRKPTYS